MTKLFLLITTTFITSVTYAKEDSLIARIGNKAKVVFYGDKPQDLNEIGKYDLNLLFKELKKRSEKNFSLSEEITLKEADELKNREANTKVTSNKWFRQMNLNLFIGTTRATIQGYRSSNSFVNRLSNYDGYFLGIFTNREGSNIPIRGIYRIENEPATMFGIGGFFDRILMQKRRFDVSLRFGTGFDFINTKLTLKRAGSISFLSDSTSTPETPLPITEFLKRRIHSTNLYAEVQPTINLHNNKGEKTFKLGVGIKVAASLNNFNKTTFTEAILYQSGSPLISLKHKALQTALTGTIGYKYINLFFLVIPNNIIINGTTRTFALPYDAPQQLSGTSYSIGLRFGK